jgi:DNA-directed RNA polymerase specialized sigma24 family protein
MDETTAWAVRSADAQLISATASGDVAAYALLHQRHKAAAQNLAAQLSADPAEVEAIVSAAFAELHGVLRSGGGPTEALRPYLLTVVRGGAHDRQASNGAQAESASFADPSVSLLGRAFMSLPERWRAAVWLTLIEQASTEETAAILGLAIDGITEFTGQARATLVDAYLGRYLSGVTRGDCKSATGALGIDSGGTVIVPDEWTAQHLRDCPACRSMVAELGDLSQSLRRVVAPIFLGSAAAAYLSSAEPDGQLLGGQHSMPPVRHQRRRPPHQQRVLAGGGALLGVLAIIGLVLALVPGQHAARRATAEFTAPSSAAPRSASPAPAHPGPTAPPTSHSSNGSLIISPSAQPTTPTPTTAAPVTSSRPRPSPTSVPTFPFPCPSGKICPQ